ncbi:uncharacterized protein (TIGR02600 family) [Prosthecobacter fusiformis]|uniref:Uncharacterized protein (TIGR02600 family) n=2 Tax=Prosthecobacter fusiformis TaxID=48464 RepID=A0A4R7RZ61_9BACT|nr:uncharacterized protein (TIGR02600 family) [Prosthecobacter fusiformis]
MKHIRLFLADARRHQGLALIIVLSMLALATIVILAFLSVADTENKATNVYSASQSSRRFADTAVNMVISQIRAGSARETPGTPVIHATQPGAVRKYAASGDFLAGYKLFSDKDMVYRATGNSGQVNQAEFDFVRNSEPPADWNQGNNLARYVDLNDPVIKGVATGAENNKAQPQIYFPIIDPRAGQDIDPTGQETPVEGFSYETKTALTSATLSGVAVGQDTAPIVKPAADTLANNINTLRLAMPVQWLYVLKDGTVGYLNDGLNFMVLDNQEGGLPGGPSVSPDEDYGVPSEVNPIVGRVAFWTDDETCKVNINTASEPTYVGQPIYYHERDHQWGDYPPATREYQRYPGHPATVALSSILYPNPLQSANRSLDTYGRAGPVANKARALAVKERIYDLIPRIHTGGSIAGTRTFEADDFDSNDTEVGSMVAIEDAMNERLYSSVDELLFDQTNDNTSRILNNAQANAEVTLFNKTTLERASAFLTASSRASEINLFGIPRIAMWPLPDASSSPAVPGTGYDSLIRFCSRLGSASNLYAFQRKLSRTIPGVGNGAFGDISIQRNLDLLNMLDKMLGNLPEGSQQPFPTKSIIGETASTFEAKLTEDNTHQLIVSMFDYIRSINLYDSFLVPSSREDWPEASSSANIYDVREDTEQFKTYTPGVYRNSSTTVDSNTGISYKEDPRRDRFFPGHGQVTPSLHPSWKVTNGGSVKGFGRFISISEIGIQFICTADGQNDMYSWRIPEKDNSAPESNVEKPRQFKIPEIALEALDADPRVSGGRTALVVDGTEYDATSQTKIFDVEQNNVPGFAPTGRYLTNLEAIHWSKTGAGANTKLFKNRFYSNYPPLSNPDTYVDYGIASGSSKPLSIEDPNHGKYRENHPGFQRENWNYTLDFDTPLETNQKRIQAMLQLEFFTPSVGYTEINPEYTIVLSGSDVSNLRVGNNVLFSTTTDLVLKSGNSLYLQGSSPEIGGFVSFRSVLLDRPVATRPPMPSDTGYESSATGSTHSQVLNLNLVSNFFTWEHGQPLEFQGGNIEIKIYDHHVNAGTTDDPVQIIQFNMLDGQFPAPDLVVVGTSGMDLVDKSGKQYTHPVIQAPHWWAFHKDGVFRTKDGELRGKELRGRLFKYTSPDPNGGSVAKVPDIDKFDIYHQCMPGAHALIYSGDLDNFKDVVIQPKEKLYEDKMLRIAYGPNETLVPARATVDDQSWNRPWHFGTDTVRALQPPYGDARLIAGKYKVEPSDWRPHRFWNDQNEYMAHNFSGYNAGGEPGFDRGISNMALVSTANNQSRGLPVNVTAKPERTPDAPHGTSNPNSGHLKMQRYYDFDDSNPGGRVGPFINKVDEGNYAVYTEKLSTWTQAMKWRFTYFKGADTNAAYANSTGSYFSPNRMVSSPVVMGSLPSRLWDANGEGAWTNLLFRPYVPVDAGESGSLVTPATSHPGQASPPDHYLLDLFWMPVVEPYAISEPLSTAGKINLNYQIMPFTHIRRATAVHAAMKGELMAALPNASYEMSKDVSNSWSRDGQTEPRFRSETNGNHYWHREIVIDRFYPETQLWWEQGLAERVQGTLRQFEERFNFGRGEMLGATGNTTADASFRGGLFRTTSQLCEMHLIPGKVDTGANVTATEMSGTKSTRDNALSKFWGKHAATGDNTRERPYSNLYAKFTTRSNTFKVHVRSQAIRKALRSVDHDKFDPDKDLVSGEFRGSFLLERYIDQADLSNPQNNVDYAAASNPFALKPLESYYRFRVLESKRFAP